MSGVASKKRKRTEDPTEDTLHLSTQDTAQVGPVLGSSIRILLRDYYLSFLWLLASFPAIQVSKSTSFQCYLNKKEPNKPFAEQDLLVVGETDTLEFVSGPETQTAGAGCRCVCIQSTYSSVLKIYIQLLCRST